MGVSLFVAAPPLSLHKVLNFLDSLSQRWRHVGQLLSIPDALVKHVESEWANNVQRLRSLIHYWLQNDPLASWRRLISHLDVYYNIAKWPTPYVVMLKANQVSNNIFGPSTKLSYTVHEWADMTY